MAQIERKFERKLKRIDPDQRSNQKYYFDQIIAHWSLIDRGIRSKIYEADLN